MTHKFYSQRKGSNPNQNGLPLPEIIELFVRIYKQLKADGYFDEYLGFYCTDNGNVPGKIRDIGLEMLLTIRKKDLWPIEDVSGNYSEDDLFDTIEFLYQSVSKPIDGTMHDWNGCGMHWHTFNRAQGQAHYLEKVNLILEHYERLFELSKNGDVLRKPEVGFEPIFEADIPTSDANVTTRVESAILRYRRHGSTSDDRRQVVRDLADVLEYLRPQVKVLLTSKDEQDLFNMANNFGIRHHNDQQKTAYDLNLWLSWMFYYYLATIHVVLRKLQQSEEKIG